MAKETRWSIVAALVFGLLLRLFFVRTYSYIQGDSLLYGDLATNLLKHGIYGFTNSGGAGVRPTLIRLPGYPLFLLVCFSIFGVGKYTAVLVVQVLIDLWTCLLAAATAKRLFGRRAGLAALWLGALCPFMATYTAAPLTEVLTLWTIALAFYATVRWQTAGAGWNRWLAVLAFALAYSVLLRPEQGLLAASVVPALIAIGWHRDAVRGLRPAMLVALLTILPLVPWTVRNWHVFHSIQPLAPKYAVDPGERNPYGFQRWYRTWAIDFASTDEVYWNFDSDQISIADLPNRAFDSNREYEATESLLSRYNETTRWTPEMDAAFAALARERIHASPLRYYLVLPVARMLNMILRPRADMLPWPDRWWQFSDDPWSTVGESAYALLNLLYLTLAGFGLVRRDAWANWRPVIFAMVATLVLRSLLLLTIDNSEPRYTLEFYPVLLVLGSAPIARWLEHRPRRSSIPQS